MSIGNYSAGDYLAAAESTADEVVVIMLRRDPDEEGRYRSVLWKATERALPKSGQVPKTGRMRMPRDAAHALREALTDAVGAPALALTLHGLTGQRLVVPATEVPTAADMRGKYSASELAALAALAHQMSVILNEAAGQATADDADRNTQTWHAHPDVVAGKALPAAFTPGGQSVTPPQQWTPGPVPPPIPPQ